MTITTNMSIAEAFGVVAGQTDGRGDCILEVMMTDGQPTFTYVAGMGIGDPMARQRL